MHPTTPVKRRANKSTIRREVQRALHRALELKNYVNGQAATAITAGADIYSMLTIPQGIGDSQRIGEQVTLTSLLLNIKVQVGAQGVIASSDEWDTVRVICFQWHTDDSAGAPTLAKILKLGPGGSDYTNAPYNLDYKRQRTILFDRTDVVFNTPVWNGSALVWENGVNSVRLANNISLPVRGRKLNYVGNATTGEDMIYLLAVSDSNFASHPTLESNFVAEYSDA